MKTLRWTRNENGSVVSIVIPVYNDPKGLRDTVSSIAACIVPPGKTIEVIVANDGANAEIAGFCAREGLVEVSISPNRGSYYARNRGIENSCGSIVGFVDADIFVDRCWISHAVEHLRNHDYVAGHIAVIAQGVSRTAWRYQQNVDFNARWHMQQSNYGPTANLWVRRRVLELLDGFDERLYSAGDMEFGRRAHAVGEFRATYAEDVIVDHPPRSIAGLFSKSKRLAYAHTVAVNSDEFRAEFTFLNSLRRHLGRDSGTRGLGIGVQILRIVLYAHRTLYKLAYRYLGGGGKFSDTVGVDDRSTVVRVTRPDAVADGGGR